MTHPDPNYAEACRLAATAQGLDPATEALTAARVPVRVDQTGGFCMVAYATDPDTTAEVGITLADDAPDDATEYHYLVILYPHGTDTAEGCDGGEVIGEALPLAALAVTVAAVLTAAAVMEDDAAPAVCPYCLGARCKSCGFTGRHDATLDAEEAPDA